MDTILFAYLTISTYIHCRNARRLYCCIHMSRFGSHGFSSSRRKCWMSTREKWRFFPSEGARTVSEFLSFAIVKSEYSGNLQFKRTTVGKFYLFRKKAAICHKRECSFSRKADPGRKAGRTIFVLESSTIYNRSKVRRYTRETPRALMTTESWS